MRIWIQTAESIKEYEVEGLIEANDRVLMTAGVLDWDIMSFRAPPYPAEPVPLPKMIPF